MVCKKYKAVAAAVLILTLMVSFVFTGCDHAVSAPASSSQQVSLALLIGNHKNSKKLNIMSPAIRELVYRVMDSYGYITIISVEGDPKVVREGSCDIEARLKEAPVDKLRQEHEQRTAEILQFAGQVAADSPEVDTLAALRMAQRSLSSAPAESDKVIFVCDTGFSTTGLCDFTNNLLCGDPHVIADALYEARAIPDLSNITVRWQNIGDVASPQQALSPRQVEQLTAIWRAIVEKGGGSFQLEQAAPLPGETDAGLPAVSVVQLAAEAPLSFELDLAVKQTFNFAEPVMFTEKQFGGFIPDSADLMDQAEAESALRPIAEHMAAHSDLSLLLAGTTAGDEDSEYDRRLSLGRAMTVKNILVSFGVDEDRLIVRGLGNTDPWHIFNAGTQGELAAQNRKVVLLDASSETALEIMGHSAQEPAF